MHEPGQMLRATHIAAGLTRCIDCVERLQIPDLHDSHFQVQILHVSLPSLAYSVSLVQPSIGAGAGGPRRAGDGSQAG